MKYYEVKFHIICPEALRADASDVVSALAGEAGFETFEETADGCLTGYVQQHLLNRELLDTLLAGCPFEEIRVSYEVSEAEDRDWNEQWEQEGFEPIVVTSTISIPDMQSPMLIIHDGRHLPDLPSPISHPSALTSIEIDAKLAFGTGTHETTRMMCASLLELPLTGCHVLDCGCGTGILGIAALKLGAEHCTAYDIDEWSVDNTRHNAVINRVDELLTTLHGDASLLTQTDERFDIVMANINRNILLNDMPAFRRVMKPGGLLLLSGFYTEDTPLLKARAEELSMTQTHQQEENGWACITLQTQKRD